MQCARDNWWSTRSLVLGGGGDGTKAMQGQKDCSCYTVRTPYDKVISLNRINTWSNGGWTLTVIIRICRHTVYALAAPIISCDRGCTGKACMAAHSGTERESMYIMYNYIYIQADDCCSCSRETIVAILLPYTLCIRRYYTVWCLSHVASTILYSESLHPTAAMSVNRFVAIELLAVRLADLPVYDICTIQSASIDVCF